MNGNNGGVLANEAYDLLFGNSKSKKKKKSSHNLQSKQSKINDTNSIVKNQYKKDNQIIPDINKIKEKLQNYKVIKIDKKENDKKIILMMKIDLLIKKEIMIIIQLNIKIIIIILKLKK